MRRIGALVLVLFASIVTLLFPSSVVAQVQYPPTTTGECDLNKMSYVASSATAVTPITPHFIDVPDMGVSFTVAEGQCVKIEFSALLAGSPNGMIEIRALFDNTPGVALPEEIGISPTVEPRYYIFTFLEPVESGLSPGGHMVEMQIRRSAGGRVVTKNRSLTVLHN